MTTHERIMQELYASSMERTIKRLWIIAKRKAKGTRKFLNILFYVRACYAP